MTTHLARVIDALERHGCRPRCERGEQYRAHCPGPCHCRGDLRPSLGVRGLPQKVLINCFGCGRAGKPEILTALGLRLSDLFAPSLAQAQPPKGQRPRHVETYTYEDSDGHELAEKVRYEPKSFRWRSPSPDGGFCWKKAAGVTLYRPPHLIDARLVLVLEGEKAVDRLTVLGFVATCPPTGANRWMVDYTEVLWRAGAVEVVVIPDNDRAGRDHARRVVKACHGFRPPVAELSIEPEAPLSAWPFAEPDDPEVQPLRAKLLTLSDLPYRGDVCDWLDAGHTATELHELIRTAPDLDQVEQAKRERRRRVDRDRQRRHRAKIERAQLAQGAA